MSIEFLPRISCSICGKQHQESNHWMRVWFSDHPRRMVIEPLKPEEIKSAADLLYSEEHVCGEQCLCRLLTKKLSSLFE